jgi:hypothetical protein
MSSGTLGFQRESRDAFTSEINETVDDFFEKLNNIAEKYGQSVQFAAL